MSGLGIQGVQALVAAKVQAVTGIGKVYTYSRLVVDEAGIVSDMKQSGRLNYWIVTPAQANPQTVLRKVGSFTHTRYNYDIHGAYALDESGASELDFVALVARVIADFELADKRLGDAVIDAGPVQWPTFEQRQLVNVLCHYCRLTVSVLEQTEP